LARKGLLVGDREGTVAAERTESVLKGRWGGQQSNVGNGEKRWRVHHEVKGPRELKKVHSGKGPRGETTIKELWGRKSPKPYGKDWSTLMRRTFDGQNPEAERSLRAAGVKPKSLLGGGRIKLQPKNKTSLPKMQGDHGKQTTLAKALRSMKSAYAG